VCENDKSRVARGSTVQRVTQVIVHSNYGLLICDDSGAVNEVDIGRGGGEALVATPDRSR
jgi:hypothetical protein